MKKSSKIALSQSLVAVPAAFSATTYNINETLSFSDYTGTDDTFITSLFFDAGTGNVQKLVNSPNDDTSGSIQPGMDVIISLFRDTSSYGTQSKATFKSSGKGYKALSSKSTASGPGSGMPVNPDWSPAIYTPEEDDLKASGFLTAGYGGFFGYASTQSPQNDDVTYFNNLSSVANSGTHYLGFTGPSDVELYAEINYNYTGATTFADSVNVVKFVVGDPGENLLNYTLVPENKHSASLLALLAGSAAVFSKRRKAS